MRGKRGLGGARRREWLGVRGEIQRAMRGNNEGKRKVKGGREGGKDNDWERRVRSERQEAGSGD